MPLSSITQHFEVQPRDRLYQGDIFRDLTFSTTKFQAEDKKELKVVEYPLQYCVLITQDCDLEQDAKNHMSGSVQNRDKGLRSLLVLPAYVAEQLRRGVHLNDDEADEQEQTSSINSEKWRLIRSNQSARYHYLVGDTKLQIPELVLDFKHYVTVPREQLYEQAEQRYIGTINVLFRENLSCRFAHYLSRVGLPALASQE